MKNPPVTSCVVSGLAIGGNTLLEAADYCDHIWAAEMSSLIDLFNFGFQSSVSVCCDDKSLTRDTATFPGSDAVWVKDAFTPTAYAFALPPGGGNAALPSQVSPRMGH